MFHKKDDDREDNDYARGLFLNKFGATGRMDINKKAKGQKLSERLDDVMKTLKDLDVKMDENGDIVVNGDMDHLPEEVRGAIERGLMKAKKKMDDNKFESVGEAKGELAQYLKDSARGMGYQVGDIVVRTEAGKKKYMKPVVERHDAAVVVEVHEYRWLVTDKGGDALRYNGAIASTSGKGNVNVFPVDLAYYERGEV